MTEASQPSSAPPAGVAPESATPLPGEPPPPPPPPGWGPTRVLGGIAVLIALALVEAGIVAAFDPDLEALAAVLTLQALLAATMIGVAFWLAPAAAGMPRSVLLGLRRSARSPWGPATLAFLVYLACALVLQALISPEQEDVTRELGYGESAFGDAAIGVLIVLAAPLSEEIFFRGFVFGGLRNRAPFVVAALVSGVLWGAFHFTGSDSWGVVVQLSVFGAILAWLYERTGSLRGPIALHVFNNAIAFAFLTST